MTMPDFGATSLQDLTALFRPGRIGNLTLRNRFVQAPIYTLFATTWGEAGEKMIEYYRERARGGVGLIITENTSVDWQVGRTSGNPLRIDHDRFRATLRDLAEAVHNEGAKIALQLHHTGRQNSATNTETGEPPIAPTAGITSVFGSPPREILIKEIPGLVDLYASGARRAKQAGFDAVELHGAHGYLLSQFLSPKTNKRSDDYGGSFEKRARFALEVVEAVRREVGPDFAVLYRMSLEEPYEGGLSVEEGLRFAKLLEPLVDAIDVSAGNYDTGITLLPMGEPGSLLEYALAVKNAVSVPVIAVGRLNWLFEEAAAHIEAGKLDFISLGRSQLADPRLVQKLRRNEPAGINLCIACNECVSRFMFNGLRTQCITNPELGQEARAAQAKRLVERPQRILIVGAGPSGMQAAIVAAKRGHTVSLIEQRDRLGGLLNGWKTPSPHAREIEHLIGYYAFELEKLGVMIHLDTAFSEAMLADHDKVVFATGTVSSRPSDTMIDAGEMLVSQTLPNAQGLLVYGSTEVAVYAAIWLAEQGKTVALHSPGEVVASNVNDMLRDHLIARLAALDVDIEVEASRPDGAATVIWAEPGAASDVGAALINDETVLAAGTRHRGGSMYEATQSGYWTAARL
jgi:2,4-dienoyl-CoA reductase-like NADH-dependent reductase (Old Yellow Enzyme family)